MAKNKKTIDGSTLWDSLKSDGHTMSYVAAQNAKVQNGELDVVAKTPGGGMILAKRDMTPYKQATVYFNKATHDLIEKKYLDKAWAVDEIIIGRKKYLALVETRKGMHFRMKPNANMCGYEYKMTLSPSATSLARELLTSKVHPRSPKFTLWEVSDDLTGGVTTLIFRPSERTVV